MHVVVASSPHTIEVRGLAKSFGDVVAVAGLDFAVERGRCLAILGPNGAGKTTTIEMLEGLRAPDRGEIVLCGMRWNGEAQRIRERIGVQLQETELPDKLRVFEVLRLFASFYRGRASRTVDEAIALVDLAEKRRSFVVDLSGGQKQRLSLACALVHRPEVLFLDEPTTGLDPAARRRTWDLVSEFKASGGTVLLTTHFMEEAERLADEILIIDHGKTLVSGSPRAIVASLGAENIVELTVAPLAGATHAVAPLAGSTHPAVPLAGAARPSTPLDEVEIARLPGVRSAKAKEGRWRIGVTSVERVLPSLLALVAEHGLELAELSVHRPTLEDVFIAATGRGLGEP